MTEPNVAREPRRRGRLVVSLLIGAIVISSLVLAVARNKQDVLDTWQLLDTKDLTGSLGFLLAALLATWLQWRTVMHAYAVPLSARESAQVFFVSQLGKYVPGSVWPFLIQARSARRHGARPVSVVAANLVVLGISLCVGLAIAGLSLPFVAEATLRRFWWTLAAVPLLVALLHPRLAPWLFNVWLRRRGESLNSAVTRQTILGASAWSVTAWFAYGGHIFMLGNDNTRGYAFLILCTGAIALAYSAGILFVPAPAGAGAREAVLVAALATMLPIPEALAIAVASRVLFLLADVTMAVLAVVVRRAT